MSAAPTTSEVAHHPNATHHNNPHGSDRHGNDYHSACLGSGLLPPAHPNGRKCGNCGGTGLTAAARRRDQQAADAEVNTHG